MTFRSSPSKVKGKRTPRRNLKHGLRGGLKSQTSSGLLDADSRRSPDIPDPEPAEISKLDDMNSGENNIYLLIYSKSETYLSNICTNLIFKGFCNEY